MPVADEKTLAAVTSFLERQKLDYSDGEEQWCAKLTVKSGPHTAYVSVFNTGAITVGGRDSPLRSLLNEMKTGIEAGDSLPGHALPFEIDKFPETIRDHVPDCDPVIVRFIEEAISCFKANALLGAAFMLGAASERAINILISTYGDSISTEQNRERFQNRVNNRHIHQKYNEFVKSYSGCQNKSTDPVLGQDIEVVVGSMFQFCRITRNEIGHPQIVPDLDRGVILANLGHFVTYIERLYGLMKHFKENSVIL